jgi:hypothetical protein
MGKQHLRKWNKAETFPLELSDANPERNSRGTLDPNPCRPSPTAAGGKEAGRRSKRGFSLLALHGWLWLYLSGLLFFIIQH